MTALVTGASGHLGATLVRALVRDGVRVRALVRGEAPALEGLAVERARGDVLDPPSLVAATDGVEVVYHLAAFVSIVPSEGARALKVNVEGPRNVAEACLRQGVRRLVHCSSVHALRPPEGDGVTDETLPPSLAPGTPAYDRSKALGEAEVLAAVARGLDAVIVNPTGVLGPYGFVPRNHLQALIDLYHGDLPALVDGGFDWVDVRDVVGGLISAAASGRTGERYLLSGQWRSLRDMAEVAAAATGRPAPRLTLPRWVASLGVPFVSAWSALTGTSPLYTAPAIRALTQHRRCSSEKARRELGYSTRPFERTIADTYRFYEAVGLLAPGAIAARPLPLEEDPLDHDRP